MAYQMVRIASFAVGGRAFRAWAPWAVVVFLVATWAAMGAGSVAAQAGAADDVRASLTADRATLTVGDLVALTLEVTHPADHVVVVPRLGPEWGPFEVMSQTTPQTHSNADGTETTSQRMKVTLFAPGAFETPGLSISVRGPDGAVRNVSPSPVKLTVNSTLSGSDETLRDIRPPADLSLPLWSRAEALAGAALVVVAALLAGSYYLYRRTRARAEQPVSQADTRTPWEAADQEIERIERLDLPGDGRLEEHYALITGVTRAYVYAMYLEGPGGADATEMTTDEISGALLESSLDRRNARMVVDLLLEADLARFSNYSPPASQAYQALRDIREIVARTRPAGDDAERRDGAYANREATA